MRIRITKALQGNVDGIDLSRFAPGFIYDVGTSLGSYLLCERWAEPVADDSPALVLPLEQQFFHPSVPPGLVQFSPRLVTGRPLRKTAEGSGGLRSVRKETRSPRQKKKPAP